MAQRNGSARNRGIAAILGASLLFGAGYSLGGIIEAEGMSRTANGLWTALFAILLNMLFGAVRRKTPFRRVTKLQLCLCAVCGVVSVWLPNFMFMVAYKSISVAEATMLHFLHPSMVAVFMSVVFKERFSFSRFLAIVCSIASMVLITGKMSAGSLGGMLAAISTGIFYSAYPILLEKSPLKDVEGATIVLYMDISSALCAIVVSLLSGQFSLPNTTTVWACDMAISITAVTAFILTRYAVRKIGATGTAFGSMLEPVFGCVIASMVLKQALGINVLFGGILVVLSVVFSSSVGRPCKQATSSTDAR